ncbi:GTPase IMAP family member 7-like protein [Labeo rohita]|uniref:GTPase IMAP family member 7-like protein n=1 Tax=Labeo rohita TaxID=84645 RepID=A0A498MDU6_LABRO|nr:GTPase IMAP family member 7-like protein [Labeo rohita]
MVDKCGGHCHVIDNKYWKSRWWGYRSNRVQVKNQLRTIDQMVTEKGCYTNELLEMVEEEVQKEFENIKEDNLSPEEKQEKAKQTVCPILGIAVPVAFLVALVKGVKKTGFDAKEDKVAVAAAAGGAAAVGTAAISAVAGVAEAVIAVEAGAAVATAAAAGTVAAVEAGIAAGAAAVKAGIAAGAAAAAVESGVAAGTGIGAAAGSGIAVGVVFGAAAVAGAIGGGVTGHRAAAEADSVLDAIKLAATANYKNARGVVEKAEQLPSNVHEKFFKK